MTKTDTTSRPRYLDLWDYKSVNWCPEKPPVDDGWEEQKKNEFCKELQKAINANPDDILLLYSSGDDGNIPDIVQREKDKKSLLRSSSGTPELFSKNADVSDEGLRVNGLAGILHFQNTTVYIHSRFDHSKENSSIAKAGDKSVYADRFLSYILRHIGIPAVLMHRCAPTSGNDLISLLLPRLFLKQLTNAFSQGFYRQYQTVEYNGCRVRGHIDVARHIRLNPMKNGRIAYSAREYTVDNPLNHLILAAYGVLRRSYSAQLDTYLQNEPELSRPIAMLETQLGREDISPTSLRRLIAEAKDPVTHPMLRDYEALRKMAMQILRFEGKNPFLHSEGDDGGSVSGILVSMPRVWERMLESRLSTILSDIGQQSFHILENRREIIPDLLSRSTGAVFDAKYKESWERVYQKELEKDAEGGQINWGYQGVREDVFQILSYMYVLNCRIGGVIHPWTDKRQYEAKSFQVSNALSNHNFILLPFAIPSGEMDQQSYDDLMDESAKKLEKWIRDILETS